MRRRVLWVSMSFTALSALVALGYSLWSDARTDDLVAQARARLEAPLADAPELDRLQASTAVSLLERAAEGGRADRELEGWLAFARALEDYQRGDLLLAEGELTSARHRLGARPDLLVLGAAVARGRSRTVDAERQLAEALEAAPDHVRGNQIGRAHV
jgi:hypothetical protein